MKAYLLTLTLLMIASALYSQNDSTKTPTTDSLIYSCPMHPEIQSTKPGKCAKCGMDLVEKNSPSAENKMGMMMCPIHGMVDMNHKHDNQSKHKRKMVVMGIVMGVMMVVMIFVHTR